MSPMSSAFGTFSGNTAHNARMAFSSCLNGAGPEGYRPPGDNGAIYQNFTVFSSGPHAIWPCRGKQTFDGMKVLDTGGDKQTAAFFAPTPQTVINSLFVARSELSAGLPPQPRAAMALYDFGVKFSKTIFDGYNEANQSAIASEIGGAIRHTDNLFSNVILRNSDRFYLQSRSLDTPSVWGAALRDTDGSAFGEPGTNVMNHPMMVRSAL
ncbi:MAG: hypothetical protein RIR70_752, partial [Pseudomonadota bacterium]